MNMPNSSNEENNSNLETQATNYIDASANNYHFENIYLQNKGPNILQNDNSDQSQSRIDDGSTDGNLAYQNPYIISNNSTSNFSNILQDENSDIRFNETSDSYLNESANDLSATLSNNFSDISTNNDSKETPNNFTNQLLSDSSKELHNIDSNDNNYPSNYNNYPSNYNNYPSNYPNNYVDTNESTSDNFNNCQDVPSNANTKSDIDVSLNDKPNSKQKLQKDNKSTSNNSIKKYMPFVSNFELQPDNHSELTDLEISNAKFRELIEDRFFFLHTFNPEKYFTVCEENNFSILQHIEKSSSFLSFFSKSKSSIMVNSNSTPMKIFSKPEISSLARSQSPEDTNSFEKYFLCHFYKTVPKSFNPRLLADQIEFHLKTPNFLLSNMRYYGLSDTEGNQIPCILTNRPVNGPLSAFYSKSRKSFFPFIKRASMKKLDIDRKFLIICGIVGGISFLHLNNFIHSNLNPTTVYLDGHLHPVICDIAFIPSFKITTVFKEDKDDYSFIYSFDEDSDLSSFSNLNFVAPEIINRSTFDSSVDIYSAGMMMFYLLAEGEPSFTDDRELIYPDGFNEEWKKLINKCISKSPSERPKAIDLLDKLLDENKMFSYLSSKPLSNLSNSYLTYLKKNREDNFDFETTKFEISHSRIPNITEIDVNFRMIISSAERGDHKSLKMIGDCLLEGKHNFIKDEQNALFCYEKAAEQGSLDSMLRVAKCFKKGRITNKDFNKAKEYYKKALNLYSKGSPEYLKCMKKIEKIDKEIENSLSITIKNVPISTTIDELKVILSRFRITPQSFIPIYRDDKYQQIRIKFENINHLNKNTLSINLNRNRIKINNEPIKFVFPEKIRFNKNNFSSIYSILPRINFSDYVPNPDMLNNFDMDDFYQLGTGTYGKVYLVYNKNTEEPLAAKIWNSQIQNDEALNYLKREVILASKLNHPAIIKYVGFDERSLIDPPSEGPTLLMNFISSNSLEQVIEENPEGWDDTSKLKVILGIVSAMNCIHKNKIIHRDLKPSNILINDNFEPVICDFGCSRQFSVEDVFFMTTLIGTFIYCAPELTYFDFNVTYQGEVDSYSFGIILYQILTSTKCLDIYPDGSKAKLIKLKLRNYRGKMPNDMNPIFVDIIEKCWNAQIDERLDFQTIYDVLIEAIENGNKKLLPNADIDKVKEYIDVLNA